jgi:hypothetical protein
MTALSATTAAAPLPRLIGTDAKFLTFRSSARGALPLLPICLAESRRLRLPLRLASIRSASIRLANIHLPRPS